MLRGRRPLGRAALLSNWHVLEGETADRRPHRAAGRVDDNRIAANGAGILVRSFLGLAGDCAMARPVGRDRPHDRRARRRGPRHRRAGARRPRREVRPHDRRHLRPGHASTRSRSWPTAPRRGRDRRLRDRPRRRAGPRRTPRSDGRRLRLGVDGLRREGAATDMIVGLHFAGESRDRRVRARLLRHQGVREARGSAWTPPSRRRGRERAALGYDAEFLPGSCRGTRARAAGSRAGLRPDGVTASGPPLHALLAGDEHVATLLPLGGVERRRQRAEAAATDGA